MAEHYAGEGGTVAFKSGMSLDVGIWRVTVEPGTPSSWSGELELKGVIGPLSEDEAAATATLREHDGKFTLLEGEISISTETAAIGTSEIRRFQGVGALEHQ